MDGMLVGGQDAPWPAPYRGPERRRSGGGAERWWRHALDEIDLGLCLVGESGAVRYANYAARSQLGHQAALQLLDGQLQAPLRNDQTRLEQAIAEAQQRGLRHLICLGQGEQRLAVSVLPMQEGNGTPLALLVLGKRHLCGTLPMLAFAREHQLTGAEQQVLTALCEGLPPQQIAQRHGVAISTVRTQIASVRAKTATESIRELVALVAQLPPLQGVLRTAEPR